MNDILNEWLDCELGIHTVDGSSFQGRLIDVTPDALCILRSDGSTLLVMRSQIVIIEPIDADIRPSGWIDEIDFDGRRYRAGKVIRYPANDDEPERIKVTYVAVPDSD